MEKIQNGKFVRLAYDIFVVNGQDQQSVFSFTSQQPDAFVFGQAPGMIPGFMQGIEGLQQGDRFDFTLKPGQAFGNRDSDMVVDVPRSVFEVDGAFDTEHVYPGATVPMRTQDGQCLEGTVTRLQGDVVTLDFNHPLAGETVRYAGTVLEVRDATPQELNAGTQGCGGCQGCGGDKGGCQGGCCDA